MRGPRSKKKALFMTPPITHCSTTCDVTTHSYSPRTVIWDGAPPYGNRARQVHDPTDVPPGPRDSSGKRSHGTLEGSKRSIQTYIPVCPRTERDGPQRAQPSRSGPDRTPISPFGCEPENTDSLETLNPCPLEPGEGTDTAKTEATYLATSIESRIRSRKTNRLLTLQRHIHARGRRCPQRSPFLACTGTHPAQRERDG